MNSFAALIVLEWRKELGRKIEYKVNQRKDYFYGVHRFTFESLRIHMDYQLTSLFDSTNDGVLLFKQERFTFESFHVAIIFFSS